MLGGELFRGYRGFGGEFGHTTVEADGLPVRVRQPRLPGDPRRPRAAAGGRGHQRRGRPTRGSARPVAELVRRAKGGDAAALAALADCGRWLGVALGTVVNLLSPQAIVLGGHFAPMTEWLAPVIASELATARPGRQRRRAARHTLQPRRRGRDARGRRDAAAPRAGRPHARGRGLVSRRPRDRRRRGCRRRLSARPRRRPSGRWSGGRWSRCCAGRRFRAEKPEMRSKRVLLVTLTRMVPRSESRSLKVRAATVDGHDGALRTGAWRHWRRARRRS